MSISELAEFTRISKYSRYLPEKQRRETWNEQVSRMMEMHKTHLGDKFPEVEEEWKFAKKFLREKRILGSQRALQFGGDAVLDKHPRLYNCAFTHIDRIRVFQEIMYTSLCGTGVGYSVQKNHVAKLPELSRNRKEEVLEYEIPDSIEGWADAVGVLVNSYFTSGSELEGHPIVFDYTKIRPQGALITSSGAKAPGPDGLRRTLEEMDKILKSALEAGEYKLRPLQVHDMICHIADSVVSGGVRRAALITLFSKDDEEMIKCKTDDWFISEPQRGRANNSVLLIRDETTREEFAEIMKSVKDYGEPGFVFVDDSDIGVNPCFPEDTWITTSKGSKQIKDLIGTPFTTCVDGDWHDSTERGFFRTGTKEVIKLETEEGFTVEATENHQFMTNQGTERVWKELKDIQEGEKIVIHKHHHISWQGKGTESEGWLLGSMMGDGCISEKTAYLDYWGEDRHEMVQGVIEKIYSEDLQTYQPITGCEATARVGKSRVQSVGLMRLANSYGIKHKYKTITDEVEKTSSDFYIGIIRGLFDADGSVQGNLEKGISVRFSNTDMNMLTRVQRMLQRLGIFSKIYRERYTEGLRELPDGRGGSAEYMCQAVHELVISKGNIQTYADRIGFTHTYKAERLNELLGSYTRKPYATKWEVTVKSKTLVGEKDVYDCTIPGPHAFDANGFYAHNCAEIGLYPIDEETGKTGFCFCNLTEINAKKCKTEQEFLDACRSSSILGTFQASYTEFPYLGETTERIVKREALLGVSITSIQDNPEIALNPEIQRKGAEVVKATNREIADKIGINHSARTTTIKPSGTASIILGSGASGIHPSHSKRYIRRVQCNRQEGPLQFFRMYNPDAVAESVWDQNGMTDVISFVCEVPKGARTKKDVDAIQLLEDVKSTWINWVDQGKTEELCVNPKTSHNVSNTINVQDYEWEEVEQYIFDNRHFFAGISLLSSQGDKIYPQAPFQAVYTEKELVQMYGTGVMFASGLIVHALKAFDNNLFAACDCLEGRGEILPDDISISVKDVEGARDELHKLIDKKSWIERAKKFAKNYFNDDLKEMTFCLKDVDILKTYTDLSNRFEPVPWEKFMELDNHTKISEDLACSSGSCEITSL